MPETIFRPKPHTAVRAALLSGTLANLVSAVVLAVCSKREEGSAAGALNGPSQWVWGEEEAYTRRATLRHTAVGYAIHHLTSIGWATVHEHTIGKSRGPKGLLRLGAEAAATATIAYIVDYHVTPSRFRPGFKKHLGPRSIFAVYASFAAGLAAGSVWNAARRGRR